MCKAKSDGGARCPFHLTLGVNTAMVSLAAAVTPLTPKRVREVMADLTQTGQSKPAPSREEVDGFLMTQEFRVRHDADLTEHKRSSILGRLRAAVGQVSPDGATFHAWKNVVAEAWSRSRRRVAGAFLVGALSFGVGACGTTSTVVTPEPTRAPAATAPATVPPSTAQSARTNDPATISAGDFSGEAVEVFGADKVAAGYAELVDLNANDGFAPDRIVPKDTYTTADFADVRESMTPSAQQSWDTTVAGALAGDTQYTTNVNTLTFFDVEGPGYAFATSGPLVTQQRISQSATGVDRSTGAERLVMTIDQHAELRMTKDGQAIRVPIDRTVNFYLSPAPEGSKRVWLIDGFQGSYTTQEAVADA